MIKVNRQEIKQEQFGDGTLKCEVPKILSDEYIYNTVDILWCYDNDSELFTLMCLVDDIRNKHWECPIKLILPYIPHARQDKNVSNRLFTLKSFAKVINSLNFVEVEVLDPHSDVSTALLDRCLKADIYIPQYMIDGGDASSGIDFDAVMFPDNGAAKKYSESEKWTKPIIIGNKYRNKEGRIESYELMNFPEGAKTVLIRDDICSYGGTFVSAAKALKEKGVEKIWLFVSHCEDNILKGEVFNYVDKVFTTDSICHIEHEKLQFVREFRKSKYGN